MGREQRAGSPQVYAAVGPGRRAVFTHWQAGIARGRIGRRRNPGMLVRKTTEDGRRGERNCPPSSVGYSPGPSATTGGWIESGFEGDRRQAARTAGGRL